MHPVRGEQPGQWKEIHKMTWTSPEGKTHMQIDHVINSKWTNLRQVEETKAAFQLEPRNRFPALEEELEEHDLSSFHSTAREAGAKILRFRGRKREEWIQKGTRDKITERKQMKEKID